MRTSIRPASETPWERAKMEQIVRADIAAFGKRESRDGECDDRAERHPGAPGSQPRPLGRHQSHRPLRAGDAPRLRRRLGDARGPAAVQDRSAGGEAAHHHHAQRVARHLLRPLDQPLSRLRARLRLLLRAADAQLYGPVAGAGLRIEALRQAGRGEAARQGAVQGRLPAAHHRHRHQHRSLPADREAVAHHARNPRSARRAQPSGRHRDQIGAGDARHRHLVAHGRARARQGGAVGDDARPDAGENDGATRVDADEAAGGDQAAQRSRHPGLGDGGADRARPDRSGDRAHPRCGPRRRRAGRRLRALEAAARSQPDLQGLAAAPLSRTATGT